MKGQEPAPTYHGRPCKMGHTLKYRSNSACVECTKNRARKYPSSKATGVRGEKYHGRPCTLGHTLRYCSNRQCVECAKADSQREPRYHILYSRWYKANFDPDGAKHREYNSRWWHRNALEIAKRRRAKDKVDQDTIRLLYYPETWK